MSFIQNMTTSAKVSLGMKTLGLNKKQTRAVDGLIESVGSHPLVLIGLGKEYTSLKQVVSTGIDMASEHAESPHLRTLGAYLAQPKARDAIADLVMQHIEKSKDRVELTQALEKLADVPIPGIADYEYETHRDFLSRGVLGLAHHHISELPSISPALELVTCPHCDGMFYAGHGHDQS